MEKEEGVEEVEGEEEGGISREGRGRKEGF